MTRRAFTSTFAGKRRTLTIGPVDLIPLSEARERRDAARKHLLDGIDPAEVKARTKGQETDIPENAFRHMAKAWHDLRKKSLAPKYAYDQWTRLERLIFPHIGDTAITDLKPKDALKIFNRLEAKGTVETAHRSIQLIGQVLRLAVTRGQVDSDITCDLRGQLPPIPRDISRASVSLAELPGLLRAIDGYDEGWPVIRLALKTVSLTLLRFSEFGLADWSEIEGLDGASPLWRVPENRMKMKKPHIVPPVKAGCSGAARASGAHGGQGIYVPVPATGAQARDQQRRPVRPLPHGL